MKENFCKMVVIHISTSVCCVSSCSYSSNDASCPTRSFPGSWAFVINQINGSIDDGPSQVKISFEPTPLGICQWPGVFGIVFLSSFLLTNFQGQYYCAMMETCPSRDFDAMLALLRKNFDDHYNGNRAPLGLFFHAVRRSDWKFQIPTFMSILLRNQFWISLRIPILHFITGYNFEKIVHFQFFSQI